MMFGTIGVSVAFMVAQGMLSVSAALVVSSLVVELLPVDSPVLVSPPVLLPPLGSVLVLLLPLGSLLGSLLGSPLGSLEGPVVSVGSVEVSALVVLPVGSVSEVGLPVSVLLLLIEPALVGSVCEAESVPESVFGGGFVIVMVVIVTVVGCVVCDVSPAPSSPQAACSTREESTNE
jgi:hypothetical protein